MKQKILTFFFTIALSLQAFAQDSLTYYKHTFGIDVFLLGRTGISLLRNIDIDGLYRYQLNHQWSANIGINYRERSGSIGVQDVERSKGNGFCFRLGPAYHTTGESVHLTFGVNAIASFMKDHVQLYGPPYNSGKEYTIHRKRLGGEIELGIEKGLSYRMGTRVVFRAGYAPTVIDNDGLEGTAFPGTYSWFDSNNYYMYATVFLFVRAGKR